MIYKEHYIELIVNKQQVELSSQDSINVRLNNVISDPTKMSSTQAEYSFEFEIPSTPTNDKIFDYANSLAKLNKFHQRYEAELYADGNLIFSGTLTLNSYKQGVYSCNLVSVKIYSLEDIFGDAVLTDIPWEIPFDGAGTSGYSIDYYNSQLETDAVFPFVSYGAFQKDPKSEDSVGKDYTSKFDLDKYNRWYVESFYPSLNMLTAMKKAFEYKGYTVGGDAFQNMFLKDIYMSCNLADEQVPQYNLGNPKFGKIDLTVQWTNPLDTSGTSIFDIGTSYGTLQDLKYPYFKSGNDYWDCAVGDCIEVKPDYNFKEIKAYDMLSTTDGGSVTLNQNSSYLYQPNEHVIVIPADGFYKIEISATTSLLTTSALTASQWVHDWNDHITAMTMSVEEKDITFNPDYKVTTPLEIQLVRNYNEDIELIKGKNNLTIHDGYPDNTTEMNHDRYSNYSNWYTCFPHEKLGLWFCPNPTDPQAVTPAYTNEANIGYVPNDGDIMAYDSVVNPNFICGFTTMGNKVGGGTAAVIKNGYSWSKSVADNFYSFYTQDGYSKLDYDVNNNYAIITSQTTFNENTYVDSPTPSFSQSTNSMSGRICCMVYLKKDDVLQLFGVHRAYNTTGGTSVTYQTSATVNLKIEAASPNTYANLLTRGYGYNSNTDFSTNLKLSNFMNNEKKISEWVQNIIDAYNLEFIQNGKNVFLNTKKINRNLITSVDLDDRVNSYDIKSQRIDYPRSMAVRYKIDTDEWGFERSVTPQSKLNEDDWEKYGDSGFTVIQLSDDTYETSTSDKNLQFSYTWYDKFNWYPVDSAFTQDSGASSTTLTIPVISKSQYMVDGYDYTESLKHDGYGQPQRFWFKPSASNAYVWTRTYPSERVQLYLPTNLWTNYQDTYLNLSYKTSEPSLLKEYFNITPYLASNYIDFEAYLSSEEYNLIKNGAMVHVDKDIYIPLEVSGFDPSGANPTELKLMKRI